MSAKYTTNLNLCPCTLNVIRMNCDLCFVALVYYKCIAIALWFIILNWYFWILMHSYWFCSLVGAKEVPSGKQHERPYEVEILLYQCIDWTSVFYYSLVRLGFLAYCSQERCCVGKFCFYLLFIPVMYSVSCHHYQVLFQRLVSIYIIAVNFKNTNHVTGSI